jgi:hypothetical protein
MSGWITDKMVSVSHTFGSLSISEEQVTDFTIWIIAIAFPLIGVGKLYLSQVMRKSTHTRTRIGDWLVKMFIAIGLAFICIGTAYGLSISAQWGWITIPVWARWLIRTIAVLTGLMSLVATVMVVKELLPFLRSPFVVDRVPTSGDRMESTSEHVESDRIKSMAD